MRVDETYDTSDFKDGNCFHNDSFVLDAVKEMHKILNERIRTSNKITEKVYSYMIREMLTVFDRSNARPEAIVL